MDQTLKIATRAAERAIDDAIDAGDYRTAEEIQEILDFSLIEEEQVQEEAPAQPETGGIKFLGFE